LNVTAVGFGQTGSAPPFDTDKWINLWVKSWNTYDLNQVDELFLLDDRVTYFSSERQGLIRGVEALRKHHEGFGFVPGGKEQPNKLWVEDIHTVQFDSTAIVTCIWFFQREDGTTQRGPSTFVYVQVGDEYRIAHVNVGNYID